MLLYFFYLKWLVCVCACVIDPVPGSGTEAFAAERQAVRRAVRQGMDKTNPCNVVRFVCATFFLIFNF